MKDLKISKKLLEEVLGYEVDAFLGINENEIDYTCCRDKNIGYEDISINIYEFAFKCKEWANITKGKYLSSGYDEFDKKWEAMMMQYTFPADTEPEAIFKACEWILKEQNNDTK